MSAWRKVLTLSCFVTCTSLAAGMADELPLFALIGESTWAPIGWVEFCGSRPWECGVAPVPPRPVVLTPRAWQTLVNVNRYVNRRIRPMNDLEHYGVVEKWAYPEDGYGDCEDFVLLKRRMLLEAGWPRDALLVTVVRDKKDDGH